MGIMSRIKPSQLASSFYRITGSFTGTLNGTSSWAVNAVTASFITGSDVYGPYGSNSVISASYAANAGINTSSLLPAATFNAFTASYTTGSFTGSFAGDGAGLTGVIPALSSSYIFVGNASNVATAVSMSGDVAIDTNGVTTIQPHVVSYDKLQYVSQSAILGSMSGSGTAITEIPIIDSYITSSIPTSLLNDPTNWDINGNYIGIAIINTYQGQSHYNSNYWYTAVDDNIWIRLIRG